MIPVKGEKLIDYIENYENFSIFKHLYNQIVSVLHVIVFLYNTIILVCNGSRQIKIVLTNI